jgi:hypothetical protein
MIFSKKKILVWCDDPPEDRVISIFAGCLANHDRAHSQRLEIIKKILLIQVPDVLGFGEGALLLVLSMYSRTALELPGNL